MAKISEQILGVRSERLEEVDSFVPGRLVEDEASNQNNGNGEDSNEYDDSSDKLSPSRVHLIKLRKLWNEWNGGDR